MSNIDATTEDYLGLCKVVADAYSTHTWRIVEMGENHVLMLNLDHDFRGSNFVRLTPEQVLELAYTARDDLSKEEQSLVAKIEDVVYLRDHPEDKGMIDGTTQV